MACQAKQDIHIVAGPTASGKSATAIELARDIGGVIINCDSLQIYGGMPLLTAQPGEEEKSEMPHRLYEALHPNQVCSAGSWRKMALPVIEEVIASGRVPIITGGSGLYIKALVEGLSPMPEIPDEVRDATVQKQRQLGNPAFHQQLAKIDPVMAERLDPGNTARLIRAWEVLEATGKSISEWQKLDRLSPPSHWDFKIHKIIPDREELYKRCNQRFLQMIDLGALDEVRVFQKRIESGEITPGVPITKALGFKSLLSYINSEITLEEATERAQGETRRYAKRQVTWFKHQL